MFSVDARYRVQHRLAQFFAAQLINLDWVLPGGDEHEVLPASSDVDDGAGHAVVTAYGLKRPDGQHSLLIVNRDQQNDHPVKIEFRDQSSGERRAFSGPVHISTFGKAQYQWHPGHTRYVGHAEYPAQPSVAAESTGMADPDGPIVRSDQNGGAAATYNLPAASVMVIRGRVPPSGSGQSPASAP